MYAKGSSIFIRLVGLLILIGVLGAGGAMLYRAGQAQGYWLGQSAAAALEGAPAQPLVPGTIYPPAFGYPGYGWSPLGGLFGLIFGTILLFFAIRLLFIPLRTPFSGRQDPHWRCNAGQGSWGAFHGSRTPDQPRTKEGPSGSDPSASSAS